MSYGEDFKWRWDMCIKKAQGLKHGEEQGYSMDCCFESVITHFQEEFREVMQAWFDKDSEQMLKELSDLINMCELMYKDVYERIHND